MQEHSIISIVKHKRKKSIIPEGEEYSRYESVNIIKCIRNYNTIFNNLHYQIKKVQNVHLPSLADIPGYVPPPVTDVMSITFGRSVSLVVLPLNTTPPGQASVRCENQFWSKRRLSALLLRGCRRLQVERRMARISLTSPPRQRLENEVGHMGGSKPGHGGQGGNLVSILLL